MKLKNFRVVILILFLFSIFYLCFDFAQHPSKHPERSEGLLANAHAQWTGVDESVVEKFAKEHGREARSPLINTDQGDLLLFVFLLAGAIGGFVMGYYWKVIITQKITNE